MSSVGVEQPGGGLPSRVPAAAEAHGENLRRREIEPEQAKERRELATDAADKTVKPDEKKNTTEVHDGILDVKDVPNNYYGNLFRQLQERVRNGEQSSGLGTNLMGVGLLLAAKYYKYTDLIPGKFEERLETDPILKEKKFTPEELAAIEANKKLSEAEKENLRKAAEIKATKEAENNKRAKKDPQMEKQSTEYVCAAMGFPVMDNATDLGARLKNTNKTFKKQVDGEEEEEEIPYYKSRNLANLTKIGAPKGTILIIVTDMKEATKVVARAINGDGDFEYFDAKDSTIKTFKLKDEKGPFKLNAMNLLVAFVPNGDIESKEKKNSDEFAAKITGFEAQTKDDLDIKDLKFEDLKAKAEAALAGAMTLSGELKDKMVAGTKDISDSMARGIDNTLTLYKKYAEANDKEITRLLEVAKKSKDEADSFQKDYDAAVAKVVASNNALDKTASITARDQKQPELARKKAESDKAAEALKYAGSLKDEIAKNIPVIEGLKKPKA